jgi:hypothetical protein
MLDLVELFTHWHAGRSQVQLSESRGIDRKRSANIWPRRSLRVSSQGQSSPHGQLEADGVVIDRVHRLGAPCAARVAPLASH